MPDVENIIEPILAAYIDQKKLQKLLEKIFGQEIVVYSKNERFIFTAQRQLTEEELESVIEDARVVK